MVRNWSICNSKNVKETECIENTSMVVVVMVVVMVVVVVAVVVAVVVDIT